MLYGQPLYLASCTGQIVSTSATGCRQGDPLRMTFFEVRFQQILREVQMTMTDLEREIMSVDYNPGIVSAYADDVGIAGDIRVLIALYPLVHGIYMKGGICISSKSTSLNLHNHDIPKLEQLTHTNDGMTFLGVPIGSSSFKQRKFQKLTHNIALPVKVPTRSIRFSNATPMHQF
jgi:hypothetical protein